MFPTTFWGNIMKGSKNFQSISSNLYWCKSVYEINLYNKQYILHNMMKHFDAYRTRNYIFKKLMWNLYDKNQLAIVWEQPLTLHD